MRQLLNCEIGLSDHSMGMGVAIASVALGASLVEKHFTVSRSSGGVDSAFSMEPAEFRLMVEESKKAWEARGKIYYGAVETENSKLSRRSLYIVEDMKAGEILTEKNLRSIRPGYGMPAKYIDYVMGMTIIKNVDRGTRLTWDLLKKNCR